MQREQRQDLAVPRAQLDAAPDLLEHRAASPEREDPEAGPRWRGTRGVGPPEHERLAVLECLDGHVLARGQRERGRPRRDLDRVAEPRRRARDDDAPAPRHQRARTARVAHDQRQVALAEVGVPPGGLEGEMALGDARHRRDERDAVGVRRPEVPRDVDAAEERPGPRVVDRRGRARPAVEQAVEVLGREDLQRVVEIAARCRSRWSRRRSRRAVRRGRRGWRPRRRASPGAPRRTGPSRASRR